MTVNGYTITGDNYFFLNYYQLMDLTSADKAGAGRVYAFPSFYVKQYEYFHYIELCKRLRKNAIGLKARGVGFSEIGAAIAVNTYNCRRNAIVVIAAQLDNYVSKTLDKCWKQLDWINDSTDGGFFKLRQIQDTVMAKRASHYKVVNGQKSKKDGCLKLQELWLISLIKFVETVLTYLYMKKVAPGPNGKSFYAGRCFSRNSGS